MDELLSLHWLGYGAVVISVMLIYGVGWHLSQPMVTLGRWAFRVALAALLAGLTLPASVIKDIVQLLALVLPQLGQISTTPNASVGMHFFLFLLVSALLPFFRLDLNAKVIVTALASLAFVTEFLQALIPDRFFDWADVATNLTGVGLGIIARWVARYLADV